MTDQLREARKLAAQMPEIERRAAQTRASLKRLEARLVASEEGHVFREQLTELARRADCEVRRIHLSDEQQRPWTMDDNPLAMTAPRGSSMKSPFVLHRRGLTLTITGTLASIEDLLRELEATGKLVYTRHLVLKPERARREQVTLQMELVFFNLSRKESATAG